VIPLVKPVQALQEQIANLALQLELCTTIHQQKHVVTLPATPVQE
jgi:hypothetical protein